MLTCSVGSWRQCVLYSAFDGRAKGLKVGVHAGRPVLSPDLYVVSALVGNFSMKY